MRIAGNFLREDLLDAAVHGVGLLLSLVGFLPLALKARAVGAGDGGGADFDFSALLGFALYELGLVTLFASATLRHLLGREAAPRGEQCGVQRSAARWRALCL